MFKNRQFLITLFLGVLLLSGCAQNANTTKSEQASVSNTLVIATSFYPIYIATINIAKDVEGVEVIDITPPTAGCLHDYSITPEDMKKLERANFFVVNGAGMESFMDKVLSQMPNLQVIEASKDIPLIQGSGDTEENPHVWVSIEYAILQVKNITDQLGTLDPTHKAAYEANAAAYIEKLTTLQDEMHQKIDVLPNKDIITFHEAFPYFAQEFGLNIVAVIEREPGSEPSAKELTETISIVENNQVKALFTEPQYPAKSAQTIADETGATVYVLDPVVTGDETPDAYLTAMRNNMETLIDALK